MKTKFQILFVLISIFCSYQYSFGQTQGLLNKKPYKLWVKSGDKSQSIKGYLKEIKEEEIIVKNRLNDKIQAIQVDNIDKLKFRKKGRIGRGILFGALGGVASGVIIGSLSSYTGDPNYYFPPAFNMAFTGTLLGITGAVIGGIIGSLKLKIAINKNQKTFKSKQDKLLKYKLRF